MVAKNIKWEAKCIKSWLKAKSSQMRHNSKNKKSWQKKLEVAKGYLEV